MKTITSRVWLAVVSLLLAALFLFSLTVGKQPVCLAETGTEVATTVPARKLISEPDKYDGRRVSVIGFYQALLELSSLKEGKHSLWVSEPSPSADISQLNERNWSWLRIEGIFRKGRAGHGGMWRGKLVDITRIEHLCTPPEMEEFSPLGGKLKGIISTPKGKLALVVHFDDKGYTIQEGSYLPGIIPKRVSAILEDRVVIDEIFERPSGKKLIRKKEVTLADSKKRPAQGRIALWEDQLDTSDNLIRNYLVCSIRSGLKEMRSCYQTLLENGSRQSGQARLRLSINPKGNVVDATFISSEILNERLIKCIVDQARQWSFITTDGGAASAECWLEFKL